MKEIKKDTCVYAMNKTNTPVYTATTGETLVFETFDCFKGQVTAESTTTGGLDWEAINPATGPVYIQGATQGDVLKVEILKIDLADTGVMCALPGGGIFGDEVKEESIKIIAVENGSAHFNENIKLPLTPMIGVIGVAPKDEAIPCGTPGSHGGNMDNTKIKEGATIYFPVFHDGALLAMGDVHACMGDGEIMVSGIEISAKITVKVEVIKQVPLENPIVESEDTVWVVASADTMEVALHNAARQMIDIVQKQQNLSFNEAGMLMSATGNAEVCQVVDPLVTMRFGMPKVLLGEKWLS